MLWIHFDEDGRVAEVYSKLYKDWSLENDDEREACSLRSEGNRPSKVFESAFPE